MGRQLSLCTNFKSHAGLWDQVRDVKPSKNSRAICSNIIKGNQSNLGPVITVLDQIRDVQVIKPDHSRTPSGMRQWVVDLK